jgi:hypothetical protein
MTEERKVLPGGRMPVQASEAIRLPSLSRPLLVFRPLATGKGTRFQAEDEQSAACSFPSRLPRPFPTFPSGLPGPACI